MITSSEVCFRAWRSTPHAPLRLVILPHPGGGAIFYRDWADDPPTINVRVVQYPCTRGPYPRSLRPQSARTRALIGKALAPLTALPLVLWGHSMGATVTYEVAPWLECEGGLRVERLFVFDRRAPSRRPGDSVHLRDDEGLLTELARLGATTIMLLEHPDLRALVLPAVRNDYRLIEIYQPRTGPLLGRLITAWPGDRDFETTVDDARSWATHIRGPFAVRVFRGDNFYQEISAISAFRQTQLRYWSARPRLHGGQENLLVVGPTADSISVPGRALRGPFVMRTRMTKC